MAGLVEEQDKLAAAMLPADDEEIAETLSAMAETWQIEVPDPNGLEMYCAALRTIPRLAFVQAREALVLTHKWPRLPAPAEFIEAARPATTAIHATKMRCHNMQKKCEVALAMLH